MTARINRTEKLDLRLTAEAKHTLTAAALAQRRSLSEFVLESASERLTKGPARHPVPVMLLARLGADMNWRGKGIGAGLLRDAILRTLQAADIAAVRALAVHAKNEAARSFYERFDFEPSPTDSLHLFALIKDLKNL